MNNNATPANVGSNDGLGPIVMPGQYANYCGQRWRVGAVGVTGGERYYWLTRWSVVLMAPATMVTPWVRKGLRKRLHDWRERTGFFMDGPGGGM